MTNYTSSRPEKSEYGEYYERYVSLVQETDIVTAMREQFAEVEKMFASIDEEKALYAYAEGKWTIKEMIGHLTDGERIFAYRALRVSRADATPVEGFEQDGYIENANFNKMALADLTAEFLLNRKANLIMFENLSDNAWIRQGTASDQPVTTRSLAYIMVGHVRHHLNILRERYLQNSSVV